MDDNKKFSIRQYREALYLDIVKRKKQQRKKWQAKYLQKLGVTDLAEMDPSPQKIVKEEEETDTIKHMMRRGDQKYHRPVTSSSEKKKDDSKKKGMDYAQYKEKYGVGKRPATGIGKN